MGWHYSSCSPSSLLSSLLPHVLPPLSCLPSSLSSLLPPILLPCFHRLTKMKSQVAELVPSPTLLPSFWPLLEFLDDPRGHSVLLSQEQVQIGVLLGIWMLRSTLCSPPPHPSHLPFLSCSHIPSAHRPPRGHTQGSLLGPRSREGAAPVGLWRDIGDHHTLPTARMIHKSWEKGGRRVRL